MLYEFSTERLLKNPQNLFEGVSIADGRTDRERAGYYAINSHLHLISL